MRNVLFAAIVASIPLARAHIAFYDPSMWGYNVSMQDFSYDNRPMAPLQQYTFQQWWFHGHLGYEPTPGAFFELPAGGVATSQLACNKGATKWWAASEGSTDIRQGEYPCPGYPTSQFHTTGVDDVKGCALSIVYNSDVNSVQPQDLTIFSVNHQCVWSVSTQFQIPQDMPPCPPGGCICAWHWIHSVDSGSAQMYMNGFRCQVTGSTSNTPVGTPQVPVRCTNNPAACNQGPQQPLYWFQAEGNNMFNGQYDPPYYLDEWGFTDGPQNGIFGNGGNNNNINTSSSSSSSSPSPSSSSSSSSPPANTPANTPATSPADNQSTPTPTPTPSNNPPQSNTPSQGNTLPQNNVPPQGNNNNGGNGGSSPSSSPSPPPSSPAPPANNNAPAPSPSPSPANNGNNNPSSNPPSTGGNGTNGSPSNPQPPSSPSPSCRPRNGSSKKKRVASRHFAHKRHNARQNHH